MRLSRIRFADFTFINKVFTSKFKRTMCHGVTRVRGKCKEAGLKKPDYVVSKTNTFKIYIFKTLVKTG